MHETTIWTALVEDMFHKNRQIFSGIPNIFCIADAILIACFKEWGKDQDEKLEKVLLVCRQANLKVNKDKYPIR